MPLKYKIIILLILYIFLFPAKVKADQVLSYYLYSSDGSEKLYPQKLVFEEGFSDSEKLWFLFEELLDYKGNMLKYIPDGTEIRWIKTENGNAKISLSSDIKHYGGCYYENALIYQLMKTVFELPSINSFTLYIDDKIDYLSEGSLIYEFDRDKIADYEKFFQTNN